MLFQEPVGGVLDPVDDPGGRVDDAEFLRVGLERGFEELLVQVAH